MSDNPETEAGHDPPPDHYSFRSTVIPSVDVTHARRKNTSSPRAKVLDYAADDEHSKHRVQDELFAEFINAIDRFVNAYASDSTNELQQWEEILRCQMRAFKTVGQSLYGKIFQCYCECEDEKRAFYVGCLYQAVHPHNVFGVESPPATQVITPR